MFASRCARVKQLHASYGIAGLSMLGYAASLPSLRTWEVEHQACGEGGCSPHRTRSIHRHPHRDASMGTALQAAQQRCVGLLRSPPTRIPPALCQYNSTPTDRNYPLLPDSVDRRSIEG